MSSYTARTSGAASSYSTRRCNAITPPCHLPSKCPQLKLVRAAGNSSIQIAREHQLQRHFIGPVGHTEPDASLDIQKFVVVIHDRPDFVELVTYRQELAQRPIIGILLERGGPLIIEIIGDARCRNEFEISKSTRIVRVYDRIKQNVHRMQVQSDDGSDFGGNVPGLPVRVIDAEFEIDSVDEGMVVRMW